MLKILEADSAGDPAFAAFSSLPDRVYSDDPAWAPDSRHIVCSRTVSYRSGVYILDTLGGSPVRLVTLEGDWHSPSWSPR